MKRVFAESNGWLRNDVDKLEETLGRRPKLLVAKPGLDGHSNGAEQITLGAREAGFDALYLGIRSTPEEIVRAALDEGVHIIGISILSGSHNELVPAILDGLKDEDLDIPMVIGGIIPPTDEAYLKSLGVKEVYTPADFRINKIMSDLVTICEDTYVQ